MAPCPVTYALCPAHTRHDLQNPCCLADSLSNLASSHLQHTSCLSASECLIYEKHISSPPTSFRKPIRKAKDHPLPLNMLFNPQPNYAHVTLTLICSYLPNISVDRASQKEVNGFEICYSGTRFYRNMSANLFIREQSGYFL